MSASCHIASLHKEKPLAITRLQLGASRLEALDRTVVPTFLDKTWMHLGDPAPTRPRYAASRLTELFRTNSLSYIARSTFQRLFATEPRVKRSELELSELYSRTNFSDFHYRKGDRLPFDDDSIDFVFSEHFFEHLFLDESLALLRECYRVMKPFGVVRTCVPDADLRTYMPPESPGFPDTKLPFSSPYKHKMRWSMYSLAEAIELAGFKAIPLRYCDKSGDYIKVSPSDIVNGYQDCPERDLIFDLSYVWRKDSSLIVDGVKKT